MLVVFSQLFVVDTKVIFGDNFVAPLNDYHMIFTLHKKFPTDLVTLTEEVLNENFIFCTVSCFDCC